MSILNPFRGIRPGPGAADKILAPPYDVLSSGEARERAAGNPDCFLHVSKAEIDLPEGTDPYSDPVYAKAAENLRDFLKRGILVQDPEPCYYVYRLDMGDHRQTGLVAAADIGAYHDGRLKKHENTQPKKLNDRIRHMEALGAQTGPVFNTYRRHPGLEALLGEITAGSADVRTEADHGVVHSLWVVGEPSLVARVHQAAGELKAVYIADGHHRSEAAAQVASRQSQAEAQRMLTVNFPHHEVHIWDYNRVVRDLGPYDPAGFVSALEKQFEVSPGALEPPRKPGEFMMYLSGAWQRLQYRGNILGDDPVEGLDISILSTHVLEPLLGIHDQRRDPRIDFVGGRRGLQELADRVDGGGMTAAFAVRPPSLDQLMAVADAGGLMPTKSTWFEPKLADGMVSLSLKS